MNDKAFKEKLIQRHLGGRVLGLAAHALFDYFTVQFLAVGEAGCSGLMQLLASNNPAMFFHALPEAIGGSLRKVVSLNEEQLLRPAMFRQDLLDDQADCLFILCDLADPFCQLALPGLARALTDSEALNVVCGIEDAQSGQEASRTVTALLRHRVTLIQSPAAAPGQAEKVLLAHWHQAFSRMISACLDTLIYPGLVGIDLSDVCCVLRDAGIAVVGCGVASGEGRGLKASQQALADAGLMAGDCAQVRGILICTSAGHDIRFKELHDVVAAIRQHFPADVNLIIGNVIDDQFGPAMEVKVLLARKRTGVPL